MSEMTKAEIASGFLFELFVTVEIYHKEDEKALSVIKNQRAYIYDNLVDFRKSIEWAFDEGNYGAIKKTDIEFIYEDFKLK